MIERFNFYDVYGYFIPGAILVAVLYAPFFLANIQFAGPLGEFATAILAVILSYIVGHVIQSMATNAISSRFGGLYPSTRQLNLSDKTFTTGVKQAIAAESVRRFAIDPQVSIDVDETAATAVVNSARQDAFRLARLLTTARKSAPYSEQFQGLYSMMRGLTVVFALGTCYMLGSIIGHFACFWQFCFNSIVIALSIMASAGFAVWRLLQPNKKQLIDRLSLVALLGAAFGGGLLITQTPAIQSEPLTTDTAAAAVYGILALRCYASYEAFSNEFARAVWTGFTLLGQNRAETAS